jgi:hypothetical protein
MTQRKNDLRRAIEHGYDAMHRGPITKREVDFALRLMASAVADNSRPRR